MILPIENQKGIKAVESVYGINGLKLAAKYLECGMSYEYVGCIKDDTDFKIRMIL